MQRSHWNRIDIILTMMIIGLVFQLVFVFIQDSQGQSSEVQPQILAKAIRNGKVTVLNLGLHFASAIHLPEPVSSVVVGDPTRFKVEHSDKEPKLVFVKPLTPEPAESNLLVSTVRGRTVSLLIRSDGQRAPGDPALGPSLAHPVHFLMDYASANSFLIEDTGQASMLIPETIPLSTPSSAKERASLSVAGDSSDLGVSRIDRLLNQQRRATLPSLEGRDFQVGISQIYEEERQIYVLFSVVNRSAKMLEVLSPQVQLSGTARNRKWSASSEQLPVTEYGLSRRKLKPGERADGVAQFEKPTFKQSRQTYWLQIAESESVDLPVLVPIRLGRSTSLKGEER